jgi:hypothetical protein
VFGGQATGFYGDVAAYHPVARSVTKTLYDRGWGRINIEPGSVFAELAAARPRDVNLQMLVLDRKRCGVGMAGFVWRDEERQARYRAARVAGVPIIRTRNGIDQRSRAQR